MKYSKKLVLTSLICLIGALTIIISHNRSAQQKLSILKTSNKPLLITIFVHGTFSPLLGLLSFTNVMADNLKDTLYRKINKKMRNDPYFYQDQPMLDRGLHPVIPTFTPDLTSNRRFAVYPLTKAYNILEELTVADASLHFFYAFGWSGLMSQTKRRLDSLRFYNCLTEEVQRLKQLHNPSEINIKIIAHSHGGNLCLNLAAVHEIIKNKGVLPLLSTPEKQESLEKMFDIIKQMPNKSIAKAKNGSLDFDYVPNQLVPPIKELIMYGTPIQPETECFFAADIFQTIYHFYSQQDIIQQLDWITTKQSFSNQRISTEILKGIPKNRKIIQCRITHDHAHQRNTLNKPSLIDQKIISEAEINKESLWSKIFSKDSPLYQTSPAPSHKELWFIPWRKEKNEKESVLWPLPCVVFTPVFTTLLNGINNAYDVDLNVSIANNSISFSILDYNGTSTKQSASLSISLIQEIKKCLSQWKPKDFTEKSSFNAIYNHLTSNKKLH